MASKFLYVANTTMQNHQLPYRRPVIPPQQNGDRLQKWSSRSYMEEIRAGQQAKLPLELTDDQAKALYEHQAEYYGAVWVGDKIPKGFVGFIWSDEPINVAKINEGLDQNEAAAKERSETILENTAAAMLEHQSEKSQEFNTPAPATAEVEIVPLPGKDGKIDAAARGAEALAPGAQPTKPIARK